MLIDRGVRKGSRAAAITSLVQLLDVIRVVCARCTIQNLAPVGS